MIEANDAKVVTLPLKGEAPFDWYRTAYLKRIDSALATLGFVEGYVSDSFKHLVDAQERVFLERGFDGDDIKRAAFLGVVASAADKKGGGPAWLMMLSFAQSAYDDLSKLEVSGVAPGPIPKIS